MTKQLDFDKIKYVYGWEFFSILSTYLMILRSVREYRRTHALRDDDEANLIKRAKNIRDHLRELHRAGK